MLDGHVRGVVLDVMTVKFVGQRGVVQGLVLQRGDALLESMIVRPFDLIGLSLCLLVRE